MIKKLSGYYLGKFSKVYTDPHKPRLARLKKYQFKKKNVNSIRVVSYNIKHSKKIDKAIELIIKSPKLYNADVICLQEMSQEAVIKIADKLKYNFIYYPAARHKFHRWDMGNAVLSKWTIKEGKKIFLPHQKTAESRRIAVSALLSLNRKKVMVFSLHKEVFMKPLQRKKQIKTIISQIPKESEFCVVAGDFNTFTKKNLKVVVDSFQESGFECATESVGWTYRHWYLLNKKSILDHVFIKGFKTMACGKVVNRKPSDHLPIWAELAFS